MKISIKNILESNLILKINALIIATCFWTILGSQVTGTISLTIPLSFYGNDNQVVQAPETITVQLSGKRTDLKLLDTESIALHVNADELEVGEQLIEVRQEHLLLPSTIKLISCSPINPIVEVIPKAA